MIQRIRIHKCLRQLRDIALHRHISHNSRQMQAHFRRFASVQQLGALSLFDKRVVDMLIHALDRAEFLQQRGRGFLSDARHARNVVRAVAHQSLEVDHSDGWKTVLFQKQLLCVFRGQRLSALSGNQQDDGTISDQL